jgi:hypothetical protein
MVQNAPKISPGDQFEGRCMSPVFWFKAIDGRPKLYSMLRNSASGPEIKLPGRILDGRLPGKNRNRPSGRPKAGRRGDFGVFPVAVRPWRTKTNETPGHPLDKCRNMLNERCIPTAQACNKLGIINGQEEPDADEIPRRSVGSPRIKTLDLSY